MNIGYTAAHGVLAATPGLDAASLPDEIDYSGGIELVASPRLTLMGDVIGRTLRGAGRLDIVSKPFQYSTGLSGLGLPLDSTPQQVVEAGFLSFRTATVSLDEFDPRPGNLTLLLGTAGVKFNLAGNLLVSGSVLFPFSTCRRSICWRTSPPSARRKPRSLAGSSCTGSVARGSTTCTPRDGKRA